VLSKYGTEQVGISTEIAVADLYNVPIDASYRARGRIELVNHIKPALQIQLSHIPSPVKHIAEDQNPIDFSLQGDKSLSVKTSMRKAGKVAPQNIGQPTAATFWSRLPNLVPNGTDIKSLTYAQSAALFKEVAQTRTAELLTEYWNNLFDCDYLLYVYNVVESDNTLTTSPTAKLWSKPQSPTWKTSQLSFSQATAEWNESCTVKYQTFSIGEFQIHNNRNCFKFRFNLSGLIDSGLL